MPAKDDPGAAAIVNEPAQQSLNVRRILRRLRAELRAAQPSKTIVRWSVRAFPWLRRPVARAPLSSIRPLWRVANPASYYFPKVYAQPKWRQKFPEARMTQSFRDYEISFYPPRFGVRVSGKACVDPNTAEVVAAPPGAESLYPAVCLLRDPRMINDELNYYHFLIDIIGKLVTLDDAGVERALPLLISDAMMDGALFKQAIARGPLAGRRWVSDGGRAVCADRIITSQYPPISPYLLRRLNEYLAVPTPSRTSTRRVYAARRPPSTRKIVNAAEITYIIESHGFETVEPARMTLDEQISVFSDARYIIFDHGAACTNLIYRYGAPLGALEIFSHTKLPPHAFWICRCLGADFKWVIGEPPRSGDDAGTDDFYVNPDVMSATVKELIGS